MGLLNVRLSFPKQINKKCFGNYFLQQHGPVQVFLLLLLKYCNWVDHWHWNNDCFNLQSHEFIAAWCLLNSWIAYTWANAFASVREFAILSWCNVFPFANFLSVWLHLQCLLTLLVWLVDSCHSWKCWHIIHWGCSTQIAECKKSTAIFLSLWLFSNWQHGQESNLWEYAGMQLSPKFIFLFWEVWNFCKFYVLFC